MLTEPSLFDWTPTALPPASSPRQRKPKRVAAKPKSERTSPDAEVQAKEPADHAPAEAPQLLTEREAAKALAISPRKLWQLRTDGHIPCIRVGRAVRYDPTDLYRWIQGQRR